VITADQLVAHAVGDYLLQSDWMANNKTKRTVAAAAHVLTYTLPFLFITQSPTALVAILVSHFVIDRWRLARYVVWTKNWMGPNLPWRECAATGYPPDRPPWMSVWLLIIADNTLHVLCNGLAIKYFG
jgi:uncharacterized protein DUF3307